MSDLANEVANMLSNDPTPAPAVEPTIEPSQVQEPIASIVPPEPVVASMPAQEPAPVVEPAPVQPKIDITTVEPTKPAEPIITTPVPTPPTQPSEVEQQRAIIEEMRATIESLAKQVSTKPAEPTPVAQTPDVISFIEKEEDLDAALNTKDNFNALLTNVSKKTQESIVPFIHQIVGSMVDTIVSQRLAAKEFYDNNKDISNNKAYVSVVANELASANPTWDMPTIMEKLGDEVRKRLNMGTVVGGISPTVPAPAAPTPAFVPGHGTRPSAGTPVLNKMAADVLDLISDL